MIKNNNIFNSLMKTPDLNLYDRVVFAVNREEKKVMTMKVSVFSVMSIFSVSGLFWSLKYLYESMTSSGFFKFISLGFSDGFAMLKYAGDYILSVVDSLPSVPLLLFLVITLISVLSVSYMISGVREIRYFRRVLA